MASHRQKSLIWRVVRSRVFTRDEAFSLVRSVHEGTPGECREAIDRALETSRVRRKAWNDADRERLAAERLVEQDEGPQEDYPTPADLPVQESPAMLRALRLAREHGIGDDT